MAPSPNKEEEKRRVSMETQADVSTTETATSPDEGAYEMRGS